VGRPRKPTALKVLHGTDRADRANPSEPRPALGAEPPPWLPETGVAREAWDRLAAVLTEMKVLTVADAEALALACVALADYLDAPSDADNWRRADAAWKRYLYGLRDFGLTPASRSKVSAAPAGESDPLEKWVAQ
jgi:phage terminase small subunit